MADEELTYEQALERIENPQWLRFIERYLSNGCNATDAALHADYARAGASVQGHRLLRNAKIQAVIEAFRRDRIMSALEVQDRLTMIARGSVAPFIVDNVEEGYLLDTTTPEAQQHLYLIRKIKTRQRVLEEAQDIVEIERYTELSLYSALDALKELAKIHGLHRDRPDVPSDAEETPDEIERRAGRLEDLAAAHRALLARLEEMDE